VNPSEFRYTRDHEWVEARPGDGLVRFGVTDYAQDALGDIVFVTLPAAGDLLVTGEACGEVESTKSVSDVFAPVSGTVRSANPDLDADPGLVNSEPYAGGWLVEVVSNETLDGLLSAAEYEAYIGDL
jgi:glycine cleavage system H protein